MWLSGPLLYLVVLGQTLAPLAEELLGQIKPYQGRTARAWTRMLKKGKDAEVNQALGALRQMGAAARPAVPALCDLLEQGPPWHRRDAVATLGQLGATCPEAVEALRQGLRNPNMTIRRAAMEGVIRLDAAGIQKLLPDVRELLDQQMFRFRRNMVEILERADLHPDKHLPVLLELLEHSRREVRRMAVQCFRKPPRRREHVRHVLPLLQDDDSDVRRQALKVLCVFAGEEKASLSYLIQGLQDYDEDVRAAAFEGIVALGGRARLLESNLLTLLEQTQDTDVGLAAAEALWRCCGHPRGKAAVVALGEEGTFQARLEAAQLLAEHARGEAATLQVLRQLLLHKDARLDRLPAKPFVDQGAAIFPLIEEALRDERTEVRQKALEILRDLPAPHRPRAVGLLVRSCRNEPDASLRYRAAFILSSVDRHRAGVEHLALLLTHRELTPSMRRSAVLQMPVHGPLAELMVPRLLSLLDGSDVNLREWAAAQLAGCGVSRPLVIARVRRLLADPDRDVREAAARVLRSFGDEAAAAVPDLVRLLADPDSMVLREVVRSLQALHPHPEQLLPRMIPLLDHPEEPVRLAAMEHLEQLGPAGQPALLALQNLLRDNDYWQRKAALDVLQAMALEERVAIDVLLPALEDAQDENRSQAVLLLGGYAKLPSSVRTRLLTLLRQDVGRTRLAAAAVLWRHERCPYALAVLRNGLHDLSSYSCVFAIKQIAALGDDARPHLPALKQLLRHPESAVADAALAALLQLGAAPFPW